MHQVWCILLRLLLKTNAPACLQHLRNLVHQLLPISVDALNVCVPIGFMSIIFTCDEVRVRRSTDDIRPSEILEIVAVEAWKAVAIG